jgi:hypothetical protein
VWLANIEYCAGRFAPLNIVRGEQIPKATCQTHQACGTPRHDAAAVGRAFCCYILGSDSAGWAGPYTGETCDIYLTESRAELSPTLNPP